MSAPLKNERKAAAGLTKFSRIQSAPAGAREPLLTCPFTGEKIDIVQISGNGAYMARGPFWNTKLYHYKEELLHMLSHRAGVAPQFKGRPSISVTERTEPEPNPNADLVVADVMGGK